MAFLRRSRRLSRPVARRQGNGLGRRRARALRDALDGKIPAGTTCTELAATIDILPTFAALAGAPRSFRPDHRRQGHPTAALRRAGSEMSARSLLLLLEHGPRGAPQRALEAPFPPCVPQPEGKRRHRRQAGPVCRQDDSASALYNLESDIGETTDVAAQHPDVVARLEKLGEAAREDLGDSLTKTKGKNVRPPGKL